jgi:RNA polymerase sigma-70 factor (ECF subfamily)
MPDAAPSDAVLIERSWREPERFTALFDRYYAEIHGYVARRLGASRAEDVASETFLIAFDRRRRYELAYPNARPWLYGIASNLVARHRRAEVRRYRALSRADATQTVDGHDERVAGRLDARALRGRLAAALAHVADRDREVLLLVAWAQLSLEEAARALGIPADAPEPPSQASRARARAALAARAARRAPRLRARVAAVGALPGHRRRPRGGPEPRRDRLRRASALGGGRAARGPGRLGRGPRARRAGRQEPAVHRAARRPVDLRRRSLHRPRRQDDGPAQLAPHRRRRRGVRPCDGQVHVESAHWPAGRKRPLTDTYKGVASLPTDPDALLRWACAQHVENGDTSKDGVVYLLLNGILRGNILPPNLEAAIFRAMKQIPGVSVQTVAIFGKPTISLGFTDQWLHEELLIDPATYAYRGERSTVVKDTRIDPQKAGNTTGEVKKGETVVAERVAAAIVDKPGQR